MDHENENRLDQDGSLQDGELHEPVRLTSDFVFKYVFGSEFSTGILRSFLSAVQTDAGLPPVAEVEIRNPFNLADSSSSKTSVVDVRARDVEGTVYTIEVQALSEAAFRERALYYWAHAYALQLGKRQDYEVLSPVVGVNIVDFRIFPATLPVHSTFHLVERDSGVVVLTPHLVIHFLELPKLHGGNHPDSTAAGARTVMVIWVEATREPVRFPTKTLQLTSALTMSLLQPSRLLSDGGCTI